MVVGAGAAFLCGSADLAAAALRRTGGAALRCAAVAAGLRALEADLGCLRVMAYWRLPGDVKDPGLVI